MKMQTITKKIDIDTLLQLKADMKRQKNILEHISTSRHIVDTVIADHIHTSAHMLNQSVILVENMLDKKVRY